MGSVLRARILCALGVVAVCCAAGGTGFSCTGRAQAARGRTYEIRAQVVALPTPESGPRSLTVRHEAIERFIGRDGKVIGMDSMVMPFPVADGVSLAGISAGDPIELTLRVDWSDTEREMEITRLRRLPRGTTLAFGTAGAARS